MNNDINDYRHPAMENQGIDILSENPIIRDIKDRLYKDAQPATEYSQQPTINPQPFQPDTWVEGGTIIEDRTFSYGDYGVVERDNLASRNSTQAWEAQVAKAHRDATQGKSRYNVPVTQTPSVAPNVPEPPKPSEAQLAQLRKRDRLVTINARLKTLQHEEYLTQKKLSNIRASLRSLKEEVESLDNS